MNKLKSPESVRQFRRTALVLCVIALLSGSVLAQADQCKQEDVKNTFLALHEKLDASPGDEDVAFEVFQAVESQIASIFSYAEPRCAAECIFGSVGLASRLPAGHLLTQRTSDSVYAFQITSTDTADIAFFLFAAGILEFSRGDRAAARMLFDSVLTFPRELHNGDSYASALKVRGFVNKYDNRPEDALRDLKAASTLYARYHDDLMAEIDILAASAEIRLERGDPPSEVIHTVERAIRLYEENQEKFKEWRDAYNIYTSYAQILSELGNHEAADIAGNKALEIVEALDDQFRIAIVYTAIAGHLFSANRLPEARHHAMMGYKSFEKISKMSHMADALAVLTQIDSKRGDFETALEFSLMREGIIDSLTRTSQVHEIRRLQQSQAQSKTLSELAIEQARGRALLAERSEARMTLGLIVTAFGLVAVLALVLIYRLRAKRRTYSVLEKLVESRTVELSEHAKSLEEKNIELERFAFIASHDLKTPLRNITSFVNLASRRMSEEAKAEVGEYLDIASSYARQMNHTICDVLEFSRSEEASNHSRSIQELRLVVDQVVKMALPEFEYRNPLLTIEGNAEVICNRDYVEQIIMRLVHNALKFNESPVPILKIEIAETDNKVVEILVTDNGIGIQEEYANKVFDLFERINLQDKYPGTGLGLSFARKLARRMQGDVVLRSSTFGEGSVFVCRLPLQKAAVELTNLTEALHQPSVG